jgi:hypothetical protein
MLSKLDSGAYEMGISFFSKNYSMKFNYIRMLNIYSFLFRLYSYLHHTVLHNLCTRYGIAE